MSITSYEYSVLMKEIVLLKRQVQCLKNEIDACCNAGVPPGCTEVQISTQPQSISASVGDNFNLTVVAAGDAPITYQWKKGGVSISGATSSTYSIAGALTTDSGIYTVVITNPCGSVTSNEATISVSIVETTFAAHWGWTDAPITTVEQVAALQGSGSFVTGHTVIADFRSNTTPRFLIMAEPVSEDLKTKWYGTDLNKGNIGSDQDLFPAPAILGGFRVYTSAYPTQQEDTVIQFKIN